jgi:hypothetical protein
MSKDADIQWRARIFADNTLKAEVQKEIEKLALVLLGNYKLKTSYNKDGYDYIKPNKYRPYTFMGSWREWCVFGHSKTDLYLEVLKMLANDNSTYYPVVSYRQDNEWIEREKLEEIQEENQKYKKALEEFLNNK